MSGPAAAAREHRSSRSVQTALPHERDRWGAMAQVPSGRCVQPRPAGDSKRSRRTPPAHIVVSLADGVRRGHRQGVGARVVALEERGRSQGHHRCGRQGRGSGSRAGRDAGWRGGHRGGQPIEAVCQSGDGDRRCWLGEGGTGPASNENRGKPQSRPCEHPDHRCVLLLPRVRLPTGAGSSLALPNGCDETAGREFLALRSVSLRRRSRFAGRFSRGVEWILRTATARGA
jgi:hypothetical protein